VKICCAGIAGIKLLVGCHDRQHDKGIAMSIMPRRGICWNCGHNHDRIMINPLDSKMDKAVIKGLKKKVSELESDNKKLKLQIDDMIDGMLK
jgi:hypothetical protein